MALQKQYNLKQRNNTMTDCISLIQLVTSLNRTIYKPEHAVENPRTRALSLLLLPLVQLYIEQIAGLFSLAFLFLGLSQCNSLSHENMSPTTCQNISGLDKPEWKSLNNGLGTDLGGLERLNRKKALLSAVRKLRAETSCVNESRLTNCHLGPQQNIINVCTRTETC